MTAPAHPVSEVRRVRIMLIGMLIGMLVLSGWLVRVQALDPENLAQEAKAGRITTKTLTAPRGDILDAQGHTLAVTVERYTVSGSPEAVRAYAGDEEAGIPPGAKGAARALAPLLDVPESELRKRLSDLGDNPERPSQYTILAREITPVVWREVSALRIPGVHRETVLRRQYPAGPLAANVLGFLGRDENSTALAGLEREFDDVLRGEDGEEQYERGAAGQQIPTAFSERRDPVPGKDVHTTLNRDIQWYAQEIIASTVAYHDAQWGSIIVQDPETGHILALAEAPTFDPNDVSASDSADRGSRALSQVFEPGSTAKVITAAMALEEGLTTPEEKFMVPDTYTMSNGQRVRDSHSHEDQKRTFAGIMADSSNTGTIMVGEKASKQMRYDYLRKFGFGEISALNFPGETKGIVGTPESWDGRQQYMIMIGQGVAVNAMQATQVYSTVANEGRRMPATLVSKLGDDDVATADDDAVDPAGEQVISKETADQVLKILEGVVEEGTGNEAHVPGYRVAGKTGTAEKVREDGRGYEGYTSSFIGMAPADDPKLVVSVIVQDPKENGHYGGTVAGPAFRKVLGYSLQTLKIPPSANEPDLYDIEWE